MFLGVGENLHNHVSYTLSWTINQPNEFDLNWAAALEYVSFQKGPMASTGLSQLTGILPSSYTTPDHPDLQFFFGGYQASCATTGEIGALMDGGRRSISISPTNTHPRSKGIFIASCNFLCLALDCKSIYVRCMRLCALHKRVCFSFRNSSVSYQRSSRKTHNPWKLFERSIGHGYPPGGNSDSLVVRQHYRYGEI